MRLASSPTACAPHRARARRRRGVSVASTSASCPELSRVLDVITTRGTPFALAREDIAENCVHVTDIRATRGRDDVAAMHERYVERARTDLREVSHATVSLRAVARNEYVVQWSTTFVPEKMKFLYDLALNWPLGTLEIEKKDILDRQGEISKFTYRALFALLKRAALEGKMRIPIAKIEGASRLVFDGGKLERHEESLTLVSAINAGRVRNKRVARDLLEYLDCRKPPGTSLEAWDDAVLEKCDYYSVPGMRQLDVDGMDETSSNVEDATAVLGFFTLVTIAFGFGFGAWYMHGVQQEAVFRQMLAEGAY